MPRRGDEAPPGGRWRRRASPDRAAGRPLGRRSDRGAPTGKPRWPRRRGDRHRWTRFAPQSGRRSGPARYSTVASRSAASTESPAPVLSHRPSGTSMLAASSYRSVASCCQAPASARARPASRRASTAAPRNRSAPSTRIANAHPHFSPLTLHFQSLLTFHFSLFSFHCSQGTVENVGSARRSVAAHAHKPSATSAKGANRGSCVEYWRRRISPTDSRSMSAIASSRLRSSRAM